MFCIFLEMIKTETQKRNYDQFFKKIIELYKKKKYYFKRKIEKNKLTSNFSMYFTIYIKKRHEIFRKSYMEEIISSSLTIRVTVS